MKAWAGITAAAVLLNEAPLPIMMVHSVDAPAWATHGTLERFAETALSAPTLSVSGESVAETRSALIREICSVASSFRPGSTPSLETDPSPEAMLERAKETAAVVEPGRLSGLQGVIAALIEVLKPNPEPWLIVATRLQRQPGPLQAAHASLVSVIEELNGLLNQKRERLLDAARFAKGERPDTDVDVQLRKNQSHQSRLERLVSSLAGVPGNEATIQQANEKLVELRKAETSMRAQAEQLQKNFEAEAARHQAAAIEAEFSGPLDRAAKAADQQIRNINRLRRRLLNIALKAPQPEPGEPNVAVEAEARGGDQSTPADDPLPDDPVSEGGSDEGEREAPAQPVAHASRDDVGPEAAGPRPRMLDLLQSLQDLDSVETLKAALLQMAPPDSIRDFLVKWRTKRNAASFMDHLIAGVTAYRPGSLLTQRDILNARDRPMSGGALGVYLLGNGVPWLDFRAWVTDLASREDVVSTAEPRIETRPLMAPESQIPQVVVRPEEVSSQEPMPRQGAAPRPPSLAASDRIPLPDDWPAGVSRSGVSEGGVLEEWRIQAIKHFAQALKNRGATVGLPQIQEQMEIDRRSIFKWVESYLKRTTNAAPSVEEVAAQLHQWGVSYTPSAGKTATPQSESQPSDIKLEIPDARVAPPPKAGPVVEKDPSAVDASGEEVDEGSRAAGLSEIILWVYGRALNGPVKDLLVGIPVEQTLVIVGWIDQMNARLLNTGIVDDDASPVEISSAKDLLHLIDEIDRALQEEREVALAQVLPINMSAIRTRVEDIIRQWHRAASVPSRHGISPVSDRERALSDHISTAEQLWHQYERAHNAYLAHDLESANRLNRAVFTDLAKVSRGTSPFEKSDPRHVEWIDADQKLEKLISAVLELDESISLLDMADDHNARWLTAAEQNEIRDLKQKVLESSALVQSQPEEGQRLGVLRLLIRQRRELNDQAEQLMNERLTEKSNPELFQKAIRLIDSSLGSAHRVWVVEKMMPVMRLALKGDLVWRAYLADFLKNSPEFAEIRLLGRRQLRGLAVSSQHNAEIKLKAELFLALFEDRELAAPEPTPNAPEYAEPNRAALEKRVENLAMELADHLSRKREETSLDFKDLLKTWQELDYAVAVLKEWNLYRWICLLNFPAEKGNVKNDGSIQFQYARDWQAEMAVALQNLIQTRAEQWLDADPTLKGEVIALSSGESNDAAVATAHVISRLEKMAPRLASAHVEVRLRQAVESMISSWIRKHYGEFRELRHTRPQPVEVAYRSASEDKLLEKVADALEHFQSLRSVHVLLSQIRSGQALDVNFNLVANEIERNYGDKRKAGKVKEAFQFLKYDLSSLHHEVQNALRKPRRPSASPWLNMLLAAALLSAWSQVSPAHSAACIIFAFIAHEAGHMLDVMLLQHAMPRWRVSWGSWMSGVHIENASGVSGIVASLAMGTIGFILLPPSAASAFLVANLAFAASWPDWQRSFSSLRFLDHGAFRDAMAKRARSGRETRSST